MPNKNSYQRFKKVCFLFFAGTKIANSFTTPAHYMVWHLSQIHVQEAAMATDRTDVAI